jgi:hypothetical protein
MKARKLTATEFADKEAELIAALSEGLKKELAGCTLPSDPATDLWDLPTVDSKTVCKMSPVVEGIVGHKLHPSLIQRGGYKSVEEAVAHVVAQLRARCVTTTAPSTVAAA